MRKRQLVRALLGVAVLAVAVAALPPLAGAGLRLAAADPGEHPRLLFSAADVPQLRARITSGMPAEAWAVLKREVDGYTDPTSPAYVDPDLVNDPADPSNPDYRYYDGLVGQNQMDTYLTDLGFAYVLSGDAKYGRHAIDLMLALSSRWPAWDGNELGKGDLTRGVGLAFDWTYDLMSPAERYQIVHSMTVHETDLFSCLYSTFGFDLAGGPGFNWDSVCGGGNGLALLAVEGEPGAPADIDARLAYARERIVQTLPAQIGVKGDWAEGLNYAGYGLHNALPFAFAWRRATGEDLLALSPGIRAMARQLAYEQIPGRGSQFIPRNDASLFNPMLLEVMPMLFNVGGDATIGWLFDHTIGPEGDDIFGSGAAPAFVGNYGCNSIPEDPVAAVAQCYESPEVFTILYYRSPAELGRRDPAATGPLSQFYPEHGLVDFRTGWAGGVHEIAGSFEAKHDHPAGHYQEDLGQFTLYGYGAQFAIDAGYGHNYSCTSGSPESTLQGGCPTTDAGHATGHNVILVDGSRFTQNPWGALVHHDAILGYLDSRDATVVRSDLRAAYDSSYSAVPDAGRDVVFLRAPGQPVMLLVTDHLNRDRASHSYQWRLLTEGPVTLTGTTSFAAVEPSGARMGGAVASEDAGPQLLVEPTASAVTSDERPFEQLAVVSSVTGVRIDHLGVLALTDAGAPAVQPTSVPATGGSAISVPWSGAAAEVVARGWPDQAVAGPHLATDGELAESVLGQLPPSAIAHAGAAISTAVLAHQHLVLVAGSTLTVDGAPYVTVTGGVATVSVSGREIVASGPPGAAYRVYAPAGVDSIIVNGAPASSSGSAGGYVDFS